MANYQYLDILNETNQKFNYKARKKSFLNSNHKQIFLFHPLISLISFYIPLKIYIKIFFINNKKEKI